MRSSASGRSARSVLTLAAASSTRSMALSGRNLDGGVRGGMGMSKGNGCRLGGACSFSCKNRGGAAGPSSRPPSAAAQPGFAPGRPPPVWQVAVPEVGRGGQRRVGDAHAVVLLVPFLGARGGRIRGWWWRGGVGGPAGAPDRIGSKHAAAAATRLEPRPRPPPPRARRSLVAQAAEDGDRLGHRRRVHGHLCLEWGGGRHVRRRRSALRGTTGRGARRGLGRKAAAARGVEAPPARTTHTSPQTPTCWKRRSSPGSFSMNFRYLSREVQPMQRTSPLSEAGTGLEGGRVGGAGGC
jgi:hypothetical protein